MFYLILYLKHNLFYKIPGCLAYSDRNYSEAETYFEKACNILGIKNEDLSEPLLWYNRAVTSYQKGDLPNSADFIGKFAKLLRFWCTISLIVFITGDIIEHGALNFPELRMGINNSNEDSPSCVQSVGNSRTLHKSALIEALNLKAAVEYDLKKGDHFLGNL